VRIVLSRAPRVNLVLKNALPNGGTFNKQV
jgi:hypothetical protein